MSVIRSRPTAGVNQRFARLINFPVTFNESKTGARWRVPGFTIDHFNCAGYPSLHKLLLLEEQGHNLRERYSPFLIVSNDSSKTCVVLAQHMEVSQSVYEKARLHFPMIVEWGAFEMGRTSVTTEFTAREESTGDLMVRTLSKFVYMDLVTRKAIPLSESFIERHKDGLVGKDGVKFPALQPFQIPAKHHTREIQITHSDLDQLFHTTHSNYLKFTMDCASEAAEAGLFPNFEGGLCFHHGKSASVINTRESFVGDRLKVYVWQDQDNVHLLKSIIKKGDVDIYYATVTMFPPVQSAAARL